MSEKASQRTLWNCLGASEIKKGRHEREWMGRKARLFRNRDESLSITSARRTMDLIAHTCYTIMPAHAVAAVEPSAPCMSQGGEGLTGGAPHYRSEGIDQISTSFRCIHIPVGFCGLQRGGASDKRSGSLLYEASHIFSTYFVDVSDQLNFEILKGYENITEKSSSTQLVMRIVMPLDTILNKFKFAYSSCCKNASVSLLIVLVYFGNFVPRQIKGVVVFIGLTFSIFMIIS